SSAVAVGNPSRSSASRRASVNSARELKIATSDRVVGLDMSAVPFPLSRRRGLSRRSSTCRGDSERPELRGGRPAGGRYRSGGCTSLHLATCGRNVQGGHAFKDPASKACYQLVTVRTVDRWRAGVNKIVCFWMS